MSLTTSEPESLLIYRNRNGVRLLRAANYDPRLDKSSLAAIKSLPMNTYLVASDSSIIDLSESTAKTLNMMSIKDTIGRTPFDIFTKESAEVHVDADKKVVYGQQPIFIEESSIRTDNTNLYGVSIKLPLLDEKNKAIGLLGFSIPFGAHQITSLTHSLSKIADTGLINFQQDFLNHSLNYEAGAVVKNVYTTKRESEVIYHLVRGKSMPHIARVLGISSRTVEQHVENLKNKFGVFSKAELIELLLYL